MLRGGGEIDLWLVATDIERMMGSNRVREKLGKLAQLEDSGARIIAELTLRQRSQLRQLGVLCLQEGEIACRQHRFPAAAYLLAKGQILQPMGGGNLGS